ncbi:MAG: phenylalanine--tRNA ligase subunit beta [Candidatus Omnitrophica bacterium]|nr:phenylalanine--tRNA ligase subunit beta [Candidatus Omnitrophota bacterium]
MKVPVEWLKEYVTVRLSPKALAERLTMAGLEVVAIHDADGGPVLDLEITPNRADCLSIIGIAREVAAITGQRPKLPTAVRSSLFSVRSKRQHRTLNTEHRTEVKIRIEDRAGCSRYIGRLIDGVKIGPSPDWMQRRLLACGARPINNVVDITNYVLLESGQPLHAFDFDRLTQGTILVRRAQPKEPITTLDGTSRTLSADMLVIADAKHSVAVAGVMGGLGSEVTLTTRNVLLESALFDPTTVRRTARALGMSSESSYRFERGVDPVGVETASAHAASLIVKLAGGSLRQVLDVGARPPKRTAISLEAARASRWLGIRRSPAEIRTALARLSCHVVSRGTEDILQVSVPSFRRDLAQDVDLYEELARIGGYDRIPSSLPIGPLAGSSPQSEDTERFQQLRSLRCLCAGLGLTEAITWGLVSEADLSRCGYTAAQSVRLANPLSQDHAYLRPSLLMGLLQAVRRNHTQGESGVRLFEVGNVMPSGAREEDSRLGFVISGLWVRDWHAKDVCDFFRLKGLIEAITDRFCRSAARFVEPPGKARDTNPHPTRGATSRTPGQVRGSLCGVEAPRPWADPSQSTSVKLDGCDVGEAGRVYRAITEALDIEQDVWFAELSANALVAAASRSPIAVSAPTVFPPVKRDLSVLLDEGSPYEAVFHAICEIGGNLTSRVELIDRYAGPAIPAGKYSLTFAIEYREATRTLTASEVDALHQRIGQTLTGRFNARLR